MCVYVPVEFVSSPSDCANMQMTGYSHLYAGPHTTVGARSFHTKEGDEQAYKQVHTHTHTHTSPKPLYSLEVKFISHPLEPGQGFVTTID